jgi:hypothetical protein
MTRKAEYASWRSDKNLMALNLERWPRKLNKRLRRTAVDDGRSLRSIVVEACEEWLKKRKG